MTRRCTVLIGAPDLLPRLRKQADDETSELLLFSDADALRAFDVIMRRRPEVVALERLFAATPRGAALIRRIKADPALMRSEIRVVSHDSDDSTIVARAGEAMAQPGDSTLPSGDSQAAPAGPAVAQAAVPDAPLDQRGTRRAPRFKIVANVDVLVDGNVSSLVDLSIVGAQVLSAVVLKPNQRVRVALPDEAGSMRFNATVAWAKFEIPAGIGPRYRAGLDFADANAAAVDAFCSRYKES